MMRPDTQAAQQPESEYNFLLRTNREYAEFCSKTYTPEDMAGKNRRMSLHGLWAWQEQDRRLRSPQLPEQTLQLLIAGGFVDPAQVEQARAIIANCAQPPTAGVVPLPEPPKPTYVHPALGEMWDRLDLQRHAIAYGDARAAAAINSVVKDSLTTAAQPVEQEAVTEPDQPQHVYLTDKGAVITGIPNTIDLGEAGTAHNCDAMGCGQIHVLGRVPFTDERPSPLSDAEDTARLDWLVGMAVEVREPMLHGSRPLFYAHQVSDDCDAYKTDLRERIDAALKATGGPDHA